MVTSSPHSIARAATSASVSVAGSGTSVAFDASSWLHRDTTPNAMHDWRLSAQRNWYSPSRVRLMTPASAGGAPPAPRHASVDSPLPPHAFWRTPPPPRRLRMARAHSRTGPDGDVLV